MILGMAKMVQIRNMPDALHRKLKARAALNSMSLSSYLIRELKEIAAKPTWEEMLDRLAQRTPVQLDIPPAEVIRRGREERDRRWS
jgi:plasmid stability protein